MLPQRTAEKGDLSMKTRNLVVAGMLLGAICIMGSMSVLAEDRAMEITAETYIADFGQTVKTFVLDGVPEEAANVQSGRFCDCRMIFVAGQFRKCREKMNVTGSVL